MNQRLHRIRRFIGYEVELIRVINPSGNGKNSMKHSLIGIMAILFWVTACSSPQTDVTPEKWT